MPSIKCVSQNAAKAQLSKQTNHNWIKHRPDSELELNITRVRTRRQLRNQKHVLVDMIFLLNDVQHHLLYLQCNTTRISTSTQQIRTLGRHGTYINCCTKQSKAMYWSNICVHWWMHFIQRTHTCTGTQTSTCTSMNRNTPLEQRWKCIGLYFRPQRVRTFDPSSDMAIFGTSAS